MADPVYALPADLPNFSIAAQAIANLPQSVQLAALSAASRDVDSYLRQQFILPLLQWGDDIKQRVCDIATWRLLRVRGFNPESGADQNVKKAYDEAIEWLKMISKGQIPPSIIDSTPGSSEGAELGGPDIQSSSSRGWSTRGQGNGTGKTNGLLNGIDFVGD